MFWRARSGTRHLETRAFIFTSCICLDWALFPFQFGARRAAESSKHILEMSACHVLARARSGTIHLETRAFIFTSCICLDLAFFLFQIGARRVAKSSKCLRNECMSCFGARAQRHKTFRNQGVAEILRLLCRTLPFQIGSTEQGDRWLGHLDCSKPS